MKKQIWVVTFHFDRGNTQTNWFNTKEEAKFCLNTIVFNNEDCVNCTVYRQEIEIPEEVIRAEKMFEMRDKILAKM
jgi:hypothetical protein